MLHKISSFIAMSFLTSTAAWAGSHFESPLSTCTTINCSGMTIRGQQQSSEPFVIQVYAREGECLRLDVSTQTEDTALLIVAPAVPNTGSSDDVVGTRPIFGLDPVPITGWYTIAVSYFTYDPRISRFTLEYGRYNGGNLNCSQATAAQSMAPTQLNGSFGPSAKVKLPPAETADPAGASL
jgi:hypothetical protein